MSERRERKLRVRLDQCDNKTNTDKVFAKRKKENSLPFSFFEWTDRLNSSSSKARYIDFFSPLSLFRTFSSFLVGLVNRHGHIRRHNRIKTPLMAFTQVHVHLSSSFDNLHVQRRNNLHSDRKGERARTFVCVYTQVSDCVLPFREWASFSLRGEKDIIESSYVRLYSCLSRRWINSALITRNRFFSFDHSHSSADWERRKD